MPSVRSNVAVTPTNADQLKDDIVQPPTSIADLPDELIGEAFSHLGPTELHAARLVNKRLTSPAVRLLTEKTFFDWAAESSPDSDSVTEVKTMLSKTLIEQLRGSEYDIHATFDEFCYYDVLDAGLRFVDNGTVQWSADFLHDEGSVDFQWTARRLVLTPNLGLAFDWKGSDAKFYFLAPGQTLNVKFLSAEDIDGFETDTMVTQPGDVLLSLFLGPPVVMRKTEQPGRDWNALPSGGEWRRGDDWHQFAYDIAKKCDDEMMSAIWMRVVGEGCELKREGILYELVDDKRSGVITADGVIIWENEESTESNEDDEM